MENNTKPTQFQTSLTWGLITGFAVIVYTLILYFADLMTNKPAGYVSILISIAGIYLGTKAYRDQSLNGFISYGKALGTGVLISLFSAILSIIFITVLYTVIDTELVNKVMSESQEKLLEQGMPEEQIEKGMEMTKKIFLPMTIIGGLIFSVFAGFVISLITSAFLKKDDDKFTRDMSSIK